MGKTSYKNTTELIKDLNDRLDDLNNGQLGLSDLDDLVGSSRELYEHLIILRHVAFDKAQNETTDSLSKSEEKEVIAKAEEVSGLAFDLTKPETSVPAEVEEEQTDLHFDFTAVTEEETSTTTAENEFAASDESAQKEESEPDIQPNPAPTVSQEETENASLNDSFKKEDELSLRKKLQNTPVADIKTHISIAKKFEYISSLFNGDAEAYDEAIDFLNTCASGQDARLKLNEYTTKYSWDLEDKSIIKFIELVERRYISG
jgi:predicted secreted protein